MDMSDIYKANDNITVIRKKSKKQIGNNKLGKEKNR